MTRKETKKPSYFKTAALVAGALVFLCISVVGIRHSLYRTHALDTEIDALVYECSTQAQTHASLALNTGMNAVEGVLDAMLTFVGDFSTEQRAFADEFGSATESEWRTRIREHTPTFWTEAAVWVSGYAELLEDTSDNLAQKAIARRVKMKAEEAHVQLFRATGTYDMWNSAHDRIAYLPSSAWMNHHCNNETLQDQARARHREKHPKLDEFCAFMVFVASFFTIFVIVADS